MHLAEIFEIMHPCDLWEESKESKGPLAYTNNINNLLLFGNFGSNLMLPFKQVSHRGLSMQYNLDIFLFIYL